MSTAVLGVVGGQLESLVAVHPGAIAEPVGDGSVLVTLPNLSLPAGWNQPQTTVQFLAPVGYPAANPDCFWADASLRLAGGGMPLNTGFTPVPGTGEPRLWFSWHVTGWKPASDTLLTYVRVVQERLRRIQ